MAGFGVIAGSDRPSGGVPAPRPAPRRPEIPQLTGLRFVAAVWVLLHHASYLPLGVYERWLSPVRPLLAAGPLGVDLFFVLSGMVLARSYLERWHGAPGPRQAAGYVWGRLCRVWPLYALVTVLFGAWCLMRWTFGGDGIVTWQGTQPGLGPVGWLSQLTMTQMWTSPGIEGVSFVLPAWSVSAEWLAYLAFPLLAAIAWRMRRWPRPVLASVAMLAATPVAVASVAGADDFLWLARIAGGFTAGVLVWLVVRRVTMTAQVSVVAHRVVVAVLVEMLVVAYWSATAPSTADVPADARLFLAVPMFPVLLGALALTDRGIARWLSRPWLQHGGRISYALYLVHFPLIEITRVASTRFDALAPDTAAYGLLVPHMLLASFVLAHVAYRRVEEPARVRMQRLDPSRRPASEQALRPIPMDPVQVLRPDAVDPLISVAAATATDPSRRVGSTRRDDLASRRDAGVRRVGRRGGSPAVRPGPWTTGPPRPFAAPVPAGAAPG